MTEKKKRPPRARMVAGVTERGVEIAPGVFIPRPTPPPQPVNPFLFFTGQRPTWGWRCDHPGCPDGRMRIKWTEAQARLALANHKERKHS